MGTPPACCYATIYYAIREKYILEKYNNNLLFYKRYIDDVFGIWVPNDDSLSFEDFSKDLKFHQLEWEVNALSQKVIFLDMVLFIDNNTVKTKLYEKALNLYLYISPHSAHPPGVLSGLIIGNILRIHHLCSEPSQRREYYNKFYLRLRARGYLPKQLDSLFNKGFTLTTTKQMPTTRAKRLANDNTNLLSTPREPNDNLILHVPFHPRNPSSKEIQQSFKNEFLATSRHVAKFKRLTIAYSRPKNLGEILSYRRIDTFGGPPVSSYAD